MTSNERLRRELRALAAVNRQLQASRDQQVVTRAVRRSGVGGAWIESLAAVGIRESRVVRAPDGSVFLVEGSTKRPLRSGLLAAAIENVLGETTDVTEEELQQLTEGPPVALFEGTKGNPFVIIGGRRHSVTGLPLPYPVDDLQASDLPEGEEINVAAANISRRRFDEARTGQFQLNRARGTLARKGFVGTAKSIGRRVGSRVKRAIGG
jgi:hypothetical protein